MTDIPADDWRAITAGVSDPQELARLRSAYTVGAYRGKWLVLEAIGQVTMPDNAPIAVLVSEETEDALMRMMRDPKYWRDRDPEMVARVTEGFRRLYPRTTPDADVADMEVPE